MVGYCFLPISVGRLCYFFTNFCAIKLAAISCKAWYIIKGSRIIPTILLWVKSTFDITVPCTNDFFEPQNITVMLSALLKPKILPIKLVISITVKNKASKPIINKISSTTDKPSNRFKANDLQNEV